MTERRRILWRAEQPVRDEAWLRRNIETGIRPLVRRLLSVGVRTVWSCGGHATVCRNTVAWMSPKMRRMIVPKKPWIIIAVRKLFMLDLDVGFVMNKCRGPASVRAFCYLSKIDRRDGYALHNACPGARVFALIVFEDRNAARPKSRMK